MDFHSARYIHSETLVDWNPGSWSATLYAHVCLPSVMAASQASTAAKQKPDRPPATHAEGRILCGSSVVAGCPCVIVAWLYGHHLLSIGCAVQVILSVNFWREPAWGLRRSLDVGAAFVFVVGSGLLAMRCRRSRVVQGVYVLSALLFLNACRLWLRRSAAWVRWHVAFHVVCAMANMLLYNGLADAVA